MTKDPEYYEVYQTLGGKYFYLLVEFPIYIPSKLRKSKFKILYLIKVTPK